MKSMVPKITLSDGNKIRRLDLVCGKSKTRKNLMVLSRLQ